jgi:RNA polymerase sigma factor (sigma-70 family)
MSEEGENARFSTVVVPHLSDALTIALWLTGDRADAEDIVQEACLRAFRSIATFAGGNARAWLLAIVRNTAYSWLKKNRRKEIVAVDDLEAEERAHVERGGDFEDSISTTPEAELIARADADQFQAEIEKLPPAFREVLVLRDIQGLEYREIAEVTSVPVGTVMSRLARARRRLISAVGQGARDGINTAPPQTKSISARMLKTPRLTH